MKILNMNCTQTGGVTTEHVAVQVAEKENETENNVFD